MLDQPHTRDQESLFRRTAPPPPPPPAKTESKKEAKKKEAKKRQQEAAAAAAAARRGQLDSALQPQKKQKQRQEGGEAELAELRSAVASEKRALRFGDEKPAKRSTGGHNKLLQGSEPAVNEDGTIDLDSLRVVGTCETLEKSYLRLTSAPDPATVRPVRVLEQTLALLLRRWEERTPATLEAVYLYVSDQFRSMRQDLTVQNVKTAFAVLVYEKNARIALSMSDLHEFNACQTQLWTLFQLVPDCASVAEFTSYRILYFVHTQNSAELSAMFKSSAFVDFANPVVWHAEATRRAVEDVNWVAFARLCGEAPNMNACFMRLLAKASI